MTAPDPRSSDSRRDILRDLIVFQVKLWLEGFKDVALMPLALGAALIDLVFRSGSRRGTLYAVMRLGDRFERWVDLYGALEAPDANERTAGPLDGRPERGAPLRSKDDADPEG
jgi:hypothetical protein